MNYDTVNKNTHVKNQQSNYWMVNLKGILYQQKHLLTSTMMHTQLSASQRPYSSLWENKILMSDLYMTHRQFEITPKVKYQYQ